MVLRFLVQLDLFLLVPGIALMFQPDLLYDDNVHSLYPAMPLPVDRGSHHERRGNLLSLEVNYYQKVQGCLQRPIYQADSLIYYHK